MALKSNFYDEIFMHEKKWLEMIDRKLLNAIYCNLTLRPFYEETLTKIGVEYNETRNPILWEISVAIKDMLEQLRNMQIQYEASRIVDVTILRPFFLVNKMNNNSNQEQNKDVQLSYLLDQKSRLENEIREAKDNYVSEIPDYVEDDLP